MFIFVESVQINLPDNVGKLSQEGLAFFLRKACGWDLEGILNNRVNHVRRVVFDAEKNY